MKEAHPLEKTLGMELYATDCIGVGGRLKTRYEDFLVEEITTDNEILSFKEWLNRPPGEPTLEGKKTKYVSFTVQKMGLSTMDVSTIIASSLNLPRNLVSYAGLKDRRAVTVQRMTAPIRAASELGTLELSNIEIRDIKHSRQLVQIGDLIGNRFTILLRDIDASLDKALEVAEEVQSSPLLNYFGVQRFGISRPNTHIAGKYLIKRDFEGIIRSILCMPGEYEDKELLDARAELNDSLTPTEKIIDVFPKDLHYERTVMDELMKHPGEFKRAVTRIPPRILTLMVHAYQSFLFNRLLSKRVRSGMSYVIPEPGDFLIALDETHSGRDSWLYVTESTVDERRQQVMDMKYALALPSPGYATHLPPTRQSEMMKEILADEGITFRDFRDPQMRSIDAPGGFHRTSITLSDWEASIQDKGLLVKFSLRKGSYATVVLRELMKNHPINRI
ncbi:MAG: tRNA pseudouridine(13) synthase TruD [Candidatus Thorarchaeota archaeon]|nr:MAG: tRNA pseudouridine(13) synthase TruD [Candidatus Thorarchaeota archaeon]